MPVVQRGIATFLIRRSGHTVASGARTGAVTLIQRFGSALNLNPHLHMLFLDGSYTFRGSKPAFHRARRPQRDDIIGLLHRLSGRIVRLLERRGLLVADPECLGLDFDAESSLEHLQAASIQYRIAIGPQAGRKALTLYTVPPMEEEPASGLVASIGGFSLHAGSVCEPWQRSRLERLTLQTLPAEPDAPRPEVAESSGFSLHAGIAAKALQRDKIECLARYVSRPPVATERLSLTRGGNVRYALKTPYRDGTTHVIYEPKDFIARLAALVPKPRAHLTRYHGVFAPASRDRARIVPGTRTAACAARGEVSVRDRQRAMSWAQRLKRVFAIDIETCRQCGGKLRVIASIEEPAVIERILDHLSHTAEPIDPAHPSRAPPQGDRLV
jgi:hypothetical protein